MINSRREARALLARKTDEEGFGEAAHELARLVLAESDEYLAELEWHSGQHVRIRLDMSSHHDEHDRQLDGRTGRVRYDDDGDLFVELDHPEAAGAAKFWLMPHELVDAVPDLAPVPLPGTEPQLWSVELPGGEVRELVDADHARERLSAKDRQIAELKVELEGARKEGGT